MNPKCINLYCDRCYNKVGERIVGATGDTSDTISVKIRGQRRRAYVVTNIASVHCDFCDHAGPPLPSLLTVQDIRDGRRPEPCDEDLSKAA